MGEAMDHSLARKLLNTLGFFKDLLAPVALGTHRRTNQFWLRTPTRKKLSDE